MYTPEVFSSKCSPTFLYIAFTTCLYSLYVIFCFVLGYFWYYFGLVNVEAEIGNQYNPLAKQMRGKFKLPKNIKRIKP